MYRKCDLRLPVFEMKEKRKKKENRFYAYGEYALYLDLFSGPREVNPQQNKVGCIYVETHPTTYSYILSKKLKALLINFHCLFRRKSPLRCLLPSTDKLAHIGTYVRKPEYEYIVVIISTSAIRTAQDSTVFRLLLYDNYFSFGFEQPPLSNTYRVKRSDT